MDTALGEFYGLRYENTDAKNAKYEVVTVEQLKAITTKTLSPVAAVIPVVKPAS